MMDRTEHKPDDDASKGQKRRREREIGKDDNSDHEKDADAETKPKRKKVEKAPVIPGRLFVGGLPPNIAPEAIRQLLSAFEVNAERIEINPKQIPVLGTNFAFVDVSPAEKAIMCTSLNMSWKEKWEMLNKGVTGVNKLNKTRWKGHVLRVELAKQSKLDRIMTEIKTKDVEVAQADATDKVNVDGKDKKDKEGKRIGPWKRGKGGRLLPVLTLEKKNGRGTFIHDPAKMKHNITIFPSSSIDSAPIPLSQLTYFYDEDQEKQSLPLHTSRKVGDSDDEDESADTPIPLRRPASPRPDDNVSVTLDKEREISLSIIDSLLSTPPGSPVHLSEDEDEDGYDGDTVTEAEEALGLRDEYKIEWEARRGRENRLNVQNTRESSTRGESPKKEEKSMATKQKEEAAKEAGRGKKEAKEPNAEKEMNTKRQREMKETQDWPSKKIQQETQKNETHVQRKPWEGKPKQTEVKESKAKELHKPSTQSQPPTAPKSPSDASKTGQTSESTAQKVSTKPHERQKKSQHELGVAKEQPPSTSEPISAAPEPELTSQSGLQVGQKGWWTSMTSDATPAATQAQPTFSLFSILPSPAPGEATPSPSMQGVAPMKTGPKKPGSRTPKGDPAIASALQALKAKGTATTATKPGSAPAPTAAPKRFFADDSSASDSSSAAFVRPSDWKAEEQDWFHSRQALTKDYKNKVKTARKRQRVTTAEPS